jgi:RNA polymerase sigma-70 factor, ECF subfamily
MANSLSSACAPELTRPTTSEHAEWVHPPMALQVTESEPMAIGCIDSERTNPMATQDTLYARRVVDSLEDRELSPSTQSAAWLAALRGPPVERDAATTKLHGLLLRAARFELGRRQAALSHVRAEELNDIAMQAANDALMAVLAKLDDFRGASRFTTWAYKFALLEAGVKLRRRAWQDREVVLEPESWAAFADRGATAHEELEQAALLSSLRDAIEEELTPHQRRVFVALALNEVPIDVLAERLDSTRGALYKTLHDARGKLRRELAEYGLAQSGANDKEMMR